VFCAASHLAVAVASEGGGLSATIGRAAETGAGASSRRTRRRAAASTKRAGESIAISRFGCHLILPGVGGTGGAARCCLVRLLVSVLFPPLRMWIGSEEEESATTGNV